MPDFSRNLTPSRVGERDSMIDILNKAPERAAIPYMGGEDDTKSYSSATELVNSLLSTSDFTEKGKTVKDAELIENKRYPFFNPTIPNYEDFAAYGQGWAEKAVNGVAKGLILTGTTALQSTVGMLYGTAEMLKTGKVSSFYNNSLTQEIDEINKASEDYLPNYYTNKETDARWYSPTKLFTTNFLFDGIIKNLGFTAGAAISAMGYANVLKSIPYVSKLFTVGKAAETLAATEEAITASANSAATLGKIKSLSDKFTSSYNILNPGGRALVGGLSTLGEGSFEAYHTSQELKKQLIEEYKATHEGQEPYGIDLESIDQTAAKAGNTAMVANMALLTATQYIQLPKILGSSYMAEKGMINSLKKETGEIVFEGGKYVAKTPAGGVILKTINKVRPYLFSTSEAFEEGAQFAVTKGVEDYYKKKYNNQAHDFISSIAEGISQTLGSDEGMENILIGGLSGAMSMAKGRFSESRAKQSATQEAVAGFNERMLSDFTKETFESVNRGVKLQEEREAKIKAGNVREAKNLEADYIINYLTPRIKYGRYDLVREDIQTSRMLASTEEGWQQLINDGKALETDDRQAYLFRLDHLETVANNIKSLYQSLNLRYGNIVNKEGEYVYSPDIMNKMIYAASKVVDYDKRMQQLSLELNKQGILNTADIINDVVNGGVQEYNNAVKQILSMNSLNKDQKEDLGIALRDLEQLTLDRTLFLRQYDDIKANPLKYKTDVSISLEEPEFLNEGQEVEKIKEGREYELLQPKTAKINKTEDGMWGVMSPNGNITKFDTEEKAKVEEELINKEFANLSKVTVRSINPNGTIKVESVDGTVFNISPTDLEGYRKVFSPEERMAKDKETIDKQQELISSYSGNISTGDPSKETIEKEPAKKDASKYFASGITESEVFTDVSNSAPHIKRSRKFLNNVKTFKNRSNLRIILVTFNNEKSLGLEGLTKMSYRLSPNDEVDVEKVTDINNGLIAQVFVEQEGNKFFFVDENGVRISEVGEETDLNKIVFQTMPSTASEYSDGSPRYRDRQKDEWFKLLEGYRQKRSEILSSATNEFKPCKFTVSRGFPKISELKTKSFAGDVLIGGDNSDKIIKETEGLIKLSEDGFITHQGETLKFPKGRPVLQYGDTLEWLQNNKLGKEKAVSVYNVIKAFADDIINQSKSGKQIVLNPEYVKFLQAVLFYSTKNVVSENRISINTATMQLNIKNYSVPLSQISEKEEEIVDILSDTFHNVTKEFLKTENFSKPFVEYIFKDGNLATVKWPNYQSYLLSSKNPDGSVRNINNTPLFTQVEKPSESVPYSFEQKYATMEDFEMPIQKASRPQSSSTEQSIQVGGERRITFNNVSGNWYDNSTLDGIYSPKNKEIGDVKFTAAIDENNQATIEAEFTEEQLEKDNLLPKRIVALIQSELNKLKTPPTEELFNIKLPIPTQISQDNRAKYDELKSSLGRLKELMKCI